jgi:hypothetical protein
MPIDVSCSSKVESSDAEQPAQQCTYTPLYKPQAKDGTSKNPFSYLSSLIGRWNKTIGVETHWIFSGRCSPIRSSIVPLRCTTEWLDLKNEPCVQIGNRSLRISWALRKALVVFRQSGKQQNLWIDQICIDQSLHSEKERQVLFMKKMHRKAFQTLII